MVKEVIIEDKNISYALKDFNNLQFVCQYIVCKGSNDDPVNKNGISHLIEHYIINSSFKNNFFKKIKIHGFMSFYYTCYYWYVSTKHEAIASFKEFDCIIDNLKKDYINLKEIFIDSKREIINEFYYQTRKNRKLNKILSMIVNSQYHISLPIGNVEHIKGIDYSDIAYYLILNYKDSNVSKYVFNRKNEILVFNKSKLRKFNLSLSNDNYIGNSIQHNDRLGNFKITRLNYGLASNSIKIVFSNEFCKSSYEIVLGEIFLVQICDYLNEKLTFIDCLTYEKFFISNNQIYFIITINGLELFRYMDMFYIKEINIYKILREIITIKCFEKIIAQIKDSIINFDQWEVNENEIRMALVNHSTLRYNSYKLVRDKMEIVNFLENLCYQHYFNYLIEKVKKLNEKGIKIIY